jgi:hypothetical protein
MSVKRMRLLPIVLAVVVLLTPSVCFGAIKGRIYENKGIKAARLGMKDSAAAKKIGGSRKLKVDKDYEGAGYTVREYFFGKKKAGKYPVEMYSKGNHKVFEFVINCTTLKTKNGCHVGTAESTLVARYGSRLTKTVGSVYTDYHMGTSSGLTEFWVKNGKVWQITITRY